MGKKKERRSKPTRLEKKLRKLARSVASPAGRGDAVDEHAEFAEAAEAIVPAELQLGGGDVLGGLARLGSDSQPAPRLLAERSGERTDGRTSVDLVEGRPWYDLFRAIQERRTEKRFLARPVPHTALEVMLEAAVQAPNHKRTEPWSFVVLGDNAKRRYGEIRARAKAGRGKHRADKRARIVEQVLRIPAILGIKMHVDADPVRREEDYAATFMAVQNLLLAGTGLGIGVKIDTGGVLDDRELHELLRVGRDERLVALLYAGYPEKRESTRRRTPAAERTRWLD